MKKVVVAGHICLDITPVFLKSRMSGLISELLIPGRLVNVGQADLHTGGAVANTGLAMKMMGADVSLMGKVGADPFGDIILDILKKHGAEEGMIVRSGECTSYSVVLAPPGVDRIFLHNPGCNDTFCKDDLDFAVIKEAELFHFGYPTIMKKMYVNGGSELTNIFKAVSGGKVATSLDTSSVDERGEAAEADWEQILKNTLPYVDFFLPSFEELCFMLDKPAYFSGMKASPLEASLLADKLIEMGARVVLIKCGKAGLYYKSSTGPMPSFLHGDWRGKEGFESAYHTEKVLSATGAGDTCIAAFLTAALSQYPITDCVKLAAAQGACCVGTYDALSGLLSLNELHEKIAAGWEKNSEE